MVVMQALLKKEYRQSLKSEYTKDFRKFFRLFNIVFGMCLHIMTQLFAARMLNLLPHLFHIGKKNTYNVYL